MMGFALSDFMSEEKVLGLEELIELMERPIIIKTESLGDLEFRHILDEDIIFIENCLNEDMDNEHFCKQFLINQIINPELVLDDFNDMDDKEISRILEEYLEIEGLTKYFDFQSSYDIYTIFKEGMKCYKNYVNSIAKEQKEALMKSANAVINSFELPESLLSYLSSAEEAAIVAMSGISEVMDAMNQSHIAVAMAEAGKALETINKSSIPITMAEAGKTLETINQIYIQDIGSQVFNIVNTSAMLSATKTLEILNHQIHVWHNVMSVNESIIRASQGISLFWEKFQEEYKISSLVAQRCLKKYHWFISPNMDSYVVYEIIEVCNSETKHKQKEINHILINYFLDNGCEKLDMMREIWASNPLFDGRMKIINDCINLLKNDEKNINYSNLIVPTLIPQIEGIQMEFMKLNGLEINHNKVYNSEGEILKDSSGKNLKPKSFFRELTSNNEFLDAMNDVFLDVLLQETQPGEEYLSIHFSRHKILHGENKRYGRKVYMIRCFMILDFLSELIFIEEDN